MGAFVAVNSEGLASLFHGANIGSDIDTAVWYDSDYYKNPSKYFRARTRIVADGIFQNTLTQNGVKSKRFITPYSYLTTKLTTTQSRFNYLQKFSRSIIENFFGRFVYVYVIVRYI